MACTVNKKAFCFLEFAKTESIVTVQRTFRTIYRTEPPTDKTIREWYMKFQQSGCLCAAKTKRPAGAIFRDCRACVRNVCQEPLEVNISSTCKVGQKLGVSLPLLTISPSAWPSRLLYRRGRKSRRDLWIILYMYIYISFQIMRSRSNVELVHKPLSHVQRSGQRQLAYLRRGFALHRCRSCILLYAKDWKVITAIGASYRLSALRPASSRDWTGNPLCNLSSNNPATVIAN